MAFHFPPKLTKVADFQGKEAVNLAIIKQIKPQVLAAKFCLKIDQAVSQN